nr:hypothetical protein GCM10010200_077810 [Actinomadura rugatobispora]
MHEMGLCDAIVKAARSRARGRRVSEVKVRVGGHPVDPEVVDQGFRLAAAGTELEGAGLDLVMEPLSVHCRGCGGSTPVESARTLAACPRCGGVDVEACGRDDVVLESITVDPEAEAGAEAAAGARGGAR